MNSPSRNYTLLVSGVFFWCLLIVLPVAQVFHNPFLSALATIIDRAFSRVCHQIDDRSFHLLGIRLAVCGRCASIYGGFLAGVILWKIRIRRQAVNVTFWWCAALMPMLVNVLLESAGVDSGGIVVRAVTGAWFGGVAGGIITPIFLQACMDLKMRSYEPATE